jgi:ABC-type Fe3+-hydroxamate transport system substrate-binding protein
MSGIAAEISHMSMDAAKKFNRRCRSEKWMADYQERATDMRRAARAAEMRMKLSNWLANNGPGVSPYRDFDLTDREGGPGLRDR